jgi:asparagine N-glycosylation enzyme membrane subunit Stt3
LILSPSDNAKILNFMNFSDIGTSGVKDSAAFKKIQSFSKTNPQHLYSNISEFNLKYKKISDLYLNDTESNTTYAYGTKRQHNYSSMASLTNNYNSLIDNKSLKMLLDYNQAITMNNTLDLNSTIKLSNTTSNSFATPNTIVLNSKLNDILNANTIKGNDPIKNYINFLNKNSLLTAENDSKQFKNPLKYALNQK